MNITDEYNKIKKQYEEDLARKHQEMLEENQKKEHERIRKEAEESQNSYDAMRWNNIKDIFDSVKMNLGDEDITYALCAYIYAMKTGLSTKQFFESLASVKRTLDKQKKQK